MISRFNFVDRIGESIVYSEEQLNWIGVLLNSELKHSCIWSGKVNDVGVRRKDRDDIVGTIRDQLERVQNGFCYYCGFSFKVRGGERANRSIHREHIAPTSIYRCFIFTPENLVLACSVCNGGDYKGGVDTIERVSDNYEECLFNIIHPYFDDRSNHLIVDEDGVISVVNNSAKGEKTIELFGLDETIQVELRAMFKTYSKYSVGDVNEALLQRQLSKNHSAF